MKLEKGIPSRLHGIIFPIAGGIDTKVQANVLGYPIILPFDATILKARAYSNTAPTGADLIFDININGTTIWTTQANRLKIVNGSNAGSTTTFNTTALSAGDRLTIAVDQIGSGAAGKDIGVVLIIRTVGGENAL